MIMSNLKTIILDTNFLLIPGIFGLDIFDEIDKICDFQYEIAIIDKTKNEIENIINTQVGKNKKAAELAKVLLERHKIKEIKTLCDSTYVDDLLIKFAKGCIVATNDIKLIKRLKEQKTKVIRLRQKKYLIFEG